MMFPDKVFFYVSLVPGVWLRAAGYFSCFVLLLPLQPYACRNSNFWMWLPVISGWMGEIWYLEDCSCNVEIKQKWGENNTSRHLLSNRMKLEVWLRNPTYRKLVGGYIGILYHLLNRISSTLSRWMHTVLHQILQIKWNPKESAVIPSAWGVSLRTVSKHLIFLRHAVIVLHRSSCFMNSVQIGCLSDLTALFWDFSINEIGSGNAVLMDFSL